MSAQEEDAQGIVLGVLFGVIALVIGLVIGVGVYGARAQQSDKVEVVEIDFVDVEEQGEALVQVFFEFESADLPKEMPKMVDEVLDVLSMKPDAKVLISIFHDDSGGIAVNADIAKNRALAVKEAFLIVGVPAEQIVLRKPASAWGGEAAAAARRVEIRVQ